MDQVLLKTNIDTELFLKSLDKQQCRNKLNEFFDLICEEKSEIKANWDAVESYFHPERPSIPIEIYEKEVVPNAAMIFDIFVIWKNRVETDNRFLIQAMVNKIALPMWLIISLCYGIIGINDPNILNRYSRIRVEFEYLNSTYRIQMYTPVRYELVKFHWRAIMENIMEHSEIQPEYSEISIIGKVRSQIKQEDVARLDNIFANLLNISNNKSKIAKFFWIYVDELLIGNLESNPLFALPGIKLRTSNRLVLTQIETGTLIGK
ncbi:MAG: hypothetical protein CMM93_09360 [Rickettsiales bacterium]|nr:hypothetical protein [Rickettsiales bacterium]|tara:strand:- start:123 stop:911 length:789 start_codon:yes stop_codon:yes gene_type:complete